MKIGFSACFFHHDPQRPIFKGKRLVYAEESMLQWFMGAGILPIILPMSYGPLGVSQIVNEIDGLLLQGGSDVAPQSYGEEPLRAEWGGDHQRDLYEIELIRECMAQNKPVLGICRGLQILNVALGGTLFQDIQHQNPDAIVHRDWQVYDELEHDIFITPDSILQEIYPGVARGRIISIHHQAIKDVSPGLQIDALSVHDSIIEAVSLKESRIADSSRPFVCAVQWHPEFESPGRDHLLPRQGLLENFIKEMELRR